MRSHLLEGTVRHRRARPVSYGLEHAVWYAALDLGELDELDRKLRLFGRNRRAATTFRDLDHVLEGAPDVDASIRGLLWEAGEDPEGWRITLITNLRSLGYVFNPASFYLCRNRSDELRAIVVEVHNTYGQRHRYLLRQADANVESRFAGSMDKAFFVSPFIDRHGRYSVAVRDEDDGVRLAIALRQDGRHLLSTSLVLRHRPLTDRTLLRMLVRHPLMPHRTIALIHWHALRLWLRGVPFLPHGSDRRHDVVAAARPTEVSR